MGLSVKLMNFARQCLPVLFCALFLLSEPLHAQQQGGGGGGNSGGQNNQDGGGHSSRRNYSLKEFHDFMSTFFNIPSKFTWEDDIKPKDTTTSPARPVENFPAQEKKSILPPPTDLSTCLTLGNDGASGIPMSDLYNGTCSVNTGIPWINNVGFTGTFCPAGDYKISVQYSVGGAPATAQVVTSLSTTQQGGTVSILCSELRRPNGQKISTPSPLRGSVIYECQAGLWRLRNLTCTDAIEEVKCPAGPWPYTTAQAGKTYNVNISMPNPASHAGFGPDVACSAIGAAPAGTKWNTEKLTTQCNNGSWVMGPADHCTTTVLKNVAHPNCIGENTSLQNPYVKTGVTACMNTAGTRYYWIAPDGQPVNECADTVNGCQ